MSMPVFSQYFDQVVPGYGFIEFVNMKKRYLQKRECLSLGAELARFDGTIVI